MEGNVSLQRWQSPVILSIHMEYQAKQGALLKRAEHFRMPNRLGSAGVSIAELAGVWHVQGK